MGVENRIVLKHKGHHDEGEADATISPGMAIHRAADGLYDPDPRAQADALKGGLKIAKEDALQGKTIDDNYVDGDIVFWYVPLPGDHIHVLVKSGEDIAVGDLLITEGGGSGLFIEAAAQTKHQLQALESTGGALGANDHVVCEVLAP